MKKKVKQTNKQTENVYIWMEAQQCHTKVMETAAGSVCRRVHYNRPIGLV